MLKVRYKWSIVGLVGNGYIGRRWGFFFVFFVFRDLERWKGGGILGIEGGKIWNSLRIVGIYGLKGMLVMWGNVVGNEDGKVEVIENFC